MALVLGQINLRALHIGSVTFKHTHKSPLKISADITVYLLAQSTLWRRQLLTKNFELNIFGCTV